MSFALAGQVIVNAAIFTTIWCGFHELFYRRLSFPVTVKQIENSAERQNKFGLYVSYFPALFHGTLSTTLAAICILTYGFKYGEPSEWLEKVPAYFCASYFIHDAIIGWIRDYNDWLIQTHHILAAACMIWSLSFGGYGTDTSISIVLGEITNPLIATYEVLKFRGTPEAKIKPLIIAFLGSFIFLRTFIVPIPMWYMQNGKADLFFKVTYTGMWIISMKLIWMMVNKLAKQLSESMPKNKQAQQFYQFMKSIRKFEGVYMAVCLVLGMTGVVWFLVKGFF